MSHICDVGPTRLSADRLTAIGEEGRFTRTCDPRTGTTRVPPKTRDTRRCRLLLHTRAHSVRLHEVQEEDTTSGGGTGCDQPRRQALNHPELRRVLLVKAGDCSPSSSGHALRSTLLWEVVDRRPVASSWPIARHFPLVLRYHRVHRRDCFRRGSLGR